MQVTGVDMKIVEPGRSGPELLAYASVVLDDELLVHDCRLICTNGRTFVVFPNVERTRHCSRCGKKVRRSAGFCGECGREMPPPPPLPTPPSGEMPLGEYRDVVHPIKARLRHKITEAIVARYTEECQRCQQQQNPQSNLTTTT